MPNRGQMDYLSASLRRHYPDQVTGLASSFSTWALCLSARQAQRASKHPYDNLSPESISPALTIVNTLAACKQSNRILTKLLHYNVVLAIFDDRKRWHRSKIASKI